MTNTEFAKNILEEINNDVTKLNRDYICNVTELASLEQINEMFGSFAEFKAFVLKGIREGSFSATTPVASAPTTPAEEPASPQPAEEEPAGLTGVGIEGEATQPAVQQPAIKEIYVTDHAGQTKLVKCPAATNLKTILAAVGIDTEQGYEIRVNNQLEMDVEAIPESGSRVSAMKQIKGNK